MYGYVVPFKENLSQQDFILYRSFYCGLCINTGRLYGQLPRFTTNYDMVFFSLLAFDVKNEPVDFKERPCVLNPKKKLTVGGGGLLDKIAAVNILLCYYKALDGVIDGEGVKYKVLKKLLKKPYLKAKELLPEIDGIIDREYRALREIEGSAKAGLDASAHPFAQMMRDVTQSLLGEDADENALGLMYNVGKFVYLTDALDDKDEDDKKKRFNPFTTVYGGISGKELREKHLSELEFTFAVIANRCAECFNGITCKQSYTLMQNIVYYGIRNKIKELLASGKKLPPPKI